MKDGSKHATPTFTRYTPHHRTPRLTGQRFGRLVVTGYAGGDGQKGWWKVRCDCGTSKLLVGTELQKGNSQSCGCLRRELAAERMTSHGLSKHPAYPVWRSVLDRCQLPSHQAYARYGGRGITVCEAWSRSFDAFWQDMGPTYRPGLTIERLDNSAGYHPKNCEWRDWTRQARNKRNNVMIDTPEGSMLLCEAAERSGIGVTTLCYRAKAGWPASRMFDRPNPSNRL